MQPDIGEARPLPTSDELKKAFKAGWDAAEHAGNDEWEWGPDPRRFKTLEGGWRAWAKAQGLDVEFARLATDKQKDLMDKLEVDYDENTTLVAAQSRISEAIAQEKAERAARKRRYLEHDWDGVYAWDYGDQPF